MNANTRAIIEMSDGKTSSREIAEKLGLTPRYVRKVMKRKGLPQLPSGAQHGERNGSWRGGRAVDWDGYVVVRAPDHPRARSHTAFFLEHRLVMERKIGRLLNPGEVVDHIDGLHLHNAPENLRLFASNGEHLARTARGPRKWSAEGHRNIGARTDRGVKIQRIDNYRLRRERGEIRLQQILLAALSLGIDSPYLSGTLHHLEPFDIDPHSRPSLERALADLYREWGWPPPRSE